MELIQYREMQADVIRTLRCERTAVNDEANNYLYTHWDILVEVHWQPALMAYKQPGGPGTVPVYTPGTLPGNTDLAILSRLLAPRGLLTIHAGDSIILQSPDNTVVAADEGREQLPCDCTGGPTVESVGVPQMIGQRHWVVTLHITTDVRDIYRYSLNADGQPDPSIPGNVVVSNTWVSVEDIDYQRRSVRRFAGRAILRADLMRAYHVNANSFRDLYLFRCPNHYQRRNVHIELSADGTVCDWSFEDAMRGYDLGIGSEIVEIECFRSGTKTRGSLAKIFFDTFRNLSHLNLNLADVGVGGTAQVLAAIASAAAENVPFSFVHCRCDLTGDRNADLGRLTAIAYGICLTQLGSSFAQLFTGTTEVVFRQDVADQVFTSVEMSSRFTDDLRPSAWGGTSLEYRYQTDSRSLMITLDKNRNLIIPATPVPATVSPGTLEFIVASRQNARGVFGVDFDSNPPLVQGAFGVTPQTTPGTIPPPIRGAANVFPTILALRAAAVPQGTIPPGIEHLIVQALIGQNETTQSPTNLVTDS